MAQQPSVEELKTRLLYIQALETARCFEEGVLTSVHEADLGSILGWGFPAYTGGTLSYIDTIGTTQFVAECKRLTRLTVSASSRPRACWPARKPARPITTARRMPLPKLPEESGLP